MLLWKNRILMFLVFWYCVLFDNKFLFRDILLRYFYVDKFIFYNYKELVIKGDS